MWKGLFKATSTNEPPHLSPLTSPLTISILMFITTCCDVINREIPLSEIQRRWCTFFKPAYFFLWRTRKGLLWTKPIQRKKDTNPRICFFNESTRYTIPIVKCLISCNKYTIPIQKTPSTATKTATMSTKKVPNVDVCRFAAMQFLPQIYTLFWRTIYRPKTWCRTKNDKYEVCL